MIAKSVALCRADGTDVKTLRPYPIRNRGRFLAYSLYICATLGCGLWIGTAAADERQTYEASGFRDAHFGMNEHELRAAVTRDFALKPAADTDQLHRQPRQSRRRDDSQRTVLSRGR